MNAVMSFRQKLQYVLLFGFWGCAAVFFWGWWLLPRHVGNPVLYWATTAAMFYISTALPGMCIFYLGQMKAPKYVNARAALRSGAVKRVAVIKLMVPGSESLDLLVPQLEAMVAMKLATEKHGISVDLWLVVDKSHSAEIMDLASQYGVEYFSRHDPLWGENQVKLWNTMAPPFKAKTKAGNVNSWLFKYGQLYTNFVQLDFDHKPKPGYLLSVLGYFVDPKVKWVQAPSVYSNLKESWTARGAAEQDLGFQGPLQMGFYGLSRSPVVVGSHCTYDVQAVLEIGGFQPTRAEDHLDTVFLAAKGWKGVFVPKDIAGGDGPENFETFLSQQFAWSYSMFQILFFYMPRFIRMLPFWVSVQCLFLETWYLLVSVSTAILTFSVPAALLTDTKFSAMSYGGFLLHNIPMTVLTFAIWRWSSKWHQPKGVRISWRGAILQIARWPVVLSALIQVIFRVQKPYMITPKGVFGIAPFSMKSFRMHFGLIAVLLASCWFYGLAYTGQSATDGYLFYALWGASFFAGLFAIVLVMNIAEMRKGGMGLAKVFMLRTKAIVVLLVLVFVLGITTYASVPRIAAAIAGGLR